MNKPKQPPPLAQAALPGINRHAEECLQKIRAMLPNPRAAIVEPESAFKPPERQPGEDDEESAW